MDQSDRWRLLPRGESAPLVWVVSHNHGLLIYIFGNLCTSIHQCDSAVWGDDNVSSISHVTFFHQDVPLLGGTIWQYQLPLIWAMKFSSWVKWDLSYNRWCHWCCHPVLIRHNCLDILLVEQAVVCPAAVIHECEYNSINFHPDMGCQVSWDNTQYIPRHHHHKDQSICDPRML